MPRTTSQARLNTSYPQECLPDVVDHPIVEFDDEEIARFRLFTERRVKVAEEREKALRGVLGEAAVMRYFGMPLWFTIGPDDGFDMYLGNWTLDAKCAGSKQRNPSVIFKTASAFRADVVVLVHEIDTHRFAVCGWADQAIWSEHSEAHETNGKVKHRLLGRHLRPIDEMVAHLDKCWMRDQLGSS